MCQVKSELLLNRFKFHSNGEIEKVWFICCLASATVATATGVFDNLKYLEKVSQDIFLT